MHCKSVGVSPSAPLVDPQSLQLLMVVWGGGGVSAPRILVTLSGNICCISSPLNGDKNKEGEGKNASCCVDPSEGLEPCHSSLSLHQLSLIAREDRIPRAQLFFILFGASEAWKAKGLLLIFLLVFFFFLSFLTICSLRMRHSFHTAPSASSTQK